ncbi:MAG: PAAR domain-containing protein [Glaciimonas sp.]|nr:PAAR domain-containing protein [Glaciimonas sp.]
MAKAFIVLGDKTSHGGTVVEASGQTFAGNIGVARVGDKVTCPIRGHSTNAIATGDMTLIIDGAAVARAGDTTACGAVLIASQTATTD